MDNEIVTQLLYEADDNLTDLIKRALVRVAKGKSQKEIIDMFGFLDVSEEEILRQASFELVEPLTQSLSRRAKIVRIRDEVMKQHKLKDLENEECTYDYIVDKLWSSVQDKGDFSRVKGILDIIVALCQTIRNELLENITKLEEKWASKEHCGYPNLTLTDVFLLSTDDLNKQEDIHSLLMGRQPIKDLNSSDPVDPTKKVLWSLKIHAEKEDLEWEKKLNKALFPIDHDGEEDAEHEKKLNDTLVEDIKAIAQESVPSTRRGQLDKEIDAMFPSKFFSDDYAQESAASTRLGLLDKEIDAIFHSSNDYQQSYTGIAEVSPDSDEEKRVKAFKAWLDWGGYVHDEENVYMSQIYDELH